MIDLLERELQAVAGRTFEDTVLVAFYHPGSEMIVPESQAGEAPLAVKASHSCKRPFAEL